MSGQFFFQCIMVSLEWVKIETGFDFQFEYSTFSLDFCSVSLSISVCVCDVTALMCASCLLADCLARLLTLISCMISNNTLTRLVLRALDPSKTDMMLFLSYQPASLLATCCHDSLLKSTAHVIRGHTMCPACLDKDRLHCNSTVRLMCHNLQQYLFT